MTATKTHLSDKPFDSGIVRKENGFVSQRLCCFVVWNFRTMNTGIPSVNNSFHVFVQCLNQHVAPVHHQKRTRFRNAGILA